MPRKVRRLSSSDVQRAERPGYYPDGGGLYLQVTATGAKSWIFRYRRNRHLSSNGKPLSREMGLGSASHFKLWEVRRMAQSARRKLANGIDPIDDRRRKQMTAAEIRRPIFQKKAAAYRALRELGIEF